MRVGVGGDEELAQHGEDISKGVDEGLADVGLGVMRHGLEDSIVELDGPGDQEGGVGSLVGHCGGSGL